MRGRLLVLFCPVLLLAGEGGRLDASCHDRDEDQDGVNSCDDACPQTPAGEPVDARGCSCSNLDDDADGINNCDDLCEGAVDDLDSDGDGVGDCRDFCAGSEPGVEVDERGCPSAFVSWESAHVHPLEITPDGRHLLAVNTAGHSLEVFDLEGSSLRPTASIPVGLEPVSVRARTSTEVWVVNHVSDSVSVVDLESGAVRKTIRTGDEPCDVVFTAAGSRAFVSISQRNRIEVYSADDLSLPPVEVALDGEDPRALATDGDRVYAAIFESGNATTIIPRELVSDPSGPYGGSNPPPNRGLEIDPPPAPGSPPPPPAGLIVRRDAAGRWHDDNGGDWTAMVRRDVTDNDVAVIDAATLDVTYVTGLMNANMSLAVGPGGRVCVVGTDARNEVRFEPNLTGRFLSVLLGVFDPGSPRTVSLVDLNPHLDDAGTTVAPVLRAESIGDPRGIVWNAASDRIYVSGMGSSNVIVLDSQGGRIDRGRVGEGPTGLALDEPRGRIYVLNRLESTISMADTATLAEAGRLRFFDPTPSRVRAGQRRFYGTERSALGQASCGSCHIDARTDHLAWDLGNPRDPVKPFDQGCSGDQNPCGDWHPMKGPMATQPLIGILGSEPFHWRGDREDLSAFNRLFETLLGSDRRLDAGELADLTSFLASVVAPPNPNLDMDSSLRTAHENGGSPRAGASLFHSRDINCVSCHSRADGSKPLVASPGLLQEPQGFNIPRLRGLHEKVRARSGAANRGFGAGHDGSASSLLELLLARGIDHSGRTAVMFPDTPIGMQQARDLEAFLENFPTETPAATGVQTTLEGLETATAAQVALIGEMIRLAERGELALIAKGLQDSEPRGFLHIGPGFFLSDRGEAIRSESLLQRAGPGSEVTFTLVPRAMGRRLAVDRDGDGFLDHDELDGCSDPADPESTLDQVRSCEGRGSFRRGDVDADGDLTITDAIAILRYLFITTAVPRCLSSADADDSGAVDITDPIFALGFLFLGGPAPPRPFSACGLDPTPDGLACTEFEACGTVPGEIVNSFGTRLLLIPAGSFVMGSPEAEVGREPSGSEGPSHLVHITKPFYIGATEVTQAEYIGVMARNPSFFGGCGSCPVETVSWFDAEEFCIRLSDIEGKTYRLPTEAEWEYAARAGTTTRFHSGDAAGCSSACGPCPELDRSAWFCGNGSDGTHPVAQKEPNAWGLFDVHGNVHEWCADYYGPYPSGEISDPTGPRFGLRRVLRGGDFGTPLHGSRSASRAGPDCCNPEERSRGIGFRVVLEVGDSTPEGE